jgi:hypothetical protein
MFLRNVRLSLNYRYYNPEGHTFHSQCSEDLKFNDIVLLAEVLFLYSTNENFVHTVQENFIVTELIIIPDTSHATQLTISSHQWDASYRKSKSVP